jgi:tetrahydromethanopterin S-methyltransferase subunit E
MTVFTVLNQLDSSYYLDKFYKDLIDYAFIMIIFASWGRYLTFFLVIESISLLLQTLVKMLADAKTFIIITCLYFAVSMSIFRALF